MGGPECSLGNFQSQSAAHGQKMFHPLVSFVTSMREKPMVSDAYAEASGDPPQIIASRNACQLKKNRAATAPM